MVLALDFAPMDTATASEHVIVERDGAIVTLTFNRPEARNAMTWDMYQRLYDTCEEVDADDSVRVLVLKAPAARPSSPEPTSASSPNSRAARTGCATSATATAEQAGSPG